MILKEKKGYFIYIDLSYFRRDIILKSDKAENYNFLSLHFLCGETTVSSQNFKG